MPDISSVSRDAQDRTDHGGDEIAIDEKKITSKAPEGGDVDVVEEEPQKTYYSSFNAAVIGNVELLLAILYPDDLTTTIYQRLSNAFLIGMIVGMILFGVISDQLGRKTGAVATTILLVLGITLSTAASGTTTTGMFWMLIIARGIAGVGAGGEYPVSGAGAAEATDEDAKFRKRRGFMFAMLADLSASLGTVVLIASECFPTSIRGQMMGLISAFSKAGAAIGTQVFTAILKKYTDDPSKGNQVAFLIGSGFAVLGAIIALFIIPDISRHLNDDDEAWKKYLSENGWDAQWGDEVTRDPTGVIMDKAAS
ncbi:hypothetical protein SGCOL_000989 [Colletotrichum sp. CLE4]